MTTKLICDWCDRTTPEPDGNGFLQLAQRGNTWDACSQSCMFAIIKCLGQEHCAHTGCDNTTSEGTVYCSPACRADDELHEMLIAVDHDHHTDTAHDDLIGSLRVARRLDSAVSA